MKMRLATSVLSFLQSFFIYLKICLNLLSIFLKTFTFIY